jgi:hypothetical protein
MLRMNTYMAKSIPLGATLGVHRVGVVVCDVRREGLDSVLEGLTAESRRFRHIKRKAVST